MRTLLVILSTTLAMTCAPIAWSQTISLTTSEQARFRQLISSDGDARSIFNNSVKRMADEARADRPNPIDRIQTEGKLEGDPAKTATQRSLQDMQKVQALALAYVGTEDKSYAKTARDYIIAWVKANKPTGDPIDESNLDPLLFGYDLVSSTMSDEDRETVNHWLHELASKTLSYKDPKPWTNWNSHRIKIVGLSAFLLQDRRLIDEVVSLYKKQIQNNLRPDGASLDFETRDAVSYHDYDVWPLLVFATAAQRNGIDLYRYEAPSGASLAKSVEFLRPFAEGRASHAEFANTQVEFDRKRAAHKEKGHKIGAAYQPKHSLPALELAAAFDPSLSDLARQVRGTRSKYPSIQLLINAAREPIAG